MDSYMWPSSAGDTGTPSRRKHRRSKSLQGRGHKHQDPLLELMMQTLTERQRAESEGGGSKQLPISVAVQQPAAAPGSSCADPLAGDAPAASGGVGRGCCCSLWQRRWFKLALLLALLVAAALAVAMPLGLKLRRGGDAGAASGKRPMDPPQGGLGPRLDTSGHALVFAEDFTWWDESTWNIAIGDGSDYGLSGWGNNELQCYTASPNNVDVLPHPDYPDRDGVLRIRPVYAAAPEPCANLRAPNSTRQWTSGKVDTKGKVAFSWAGQQVFTGSDASLAAGGRRRALLATGAAPAPAGTADNSSSAAQAAGQCGSLVVEARMRMPMAAGRWSALWMMPRPQRCPSSSQQLGECGAFGPWPRSGEIDIMEHTNDAPVALGTVHFAGGSGVTHQWSSGSLDAGREALQAWAIYQLAWNCSALTFLMNGQQVHQVRKEALLDAAGGGAWPFDEPFFMILNTAVGGWLMGNATPDTAASAPLLVDYVRVYAKQGA